MPNLFHQILAESAKKTPQALALQFKNTKLSYAELTHQIDQFSNALKQLGVSHDERIAIYLPKQIETVVSFFGCAQSNGIFVPINPLLKPLQVEHILTDCGASILVTSLSRYRKIKHFLPANQSVKHIILTDCTNEEIPEGTIAWTQLESPLVNESLNREAIFNQRARIPNDLAAILYTSGSTGNPKGVMLSHQNLVIGAQSVVEYLNNSAKDRLLALLPFSFDYGLSQLTTAFLVGASVTLMEHLFASDIPPAICKYQITGFAAVPPLWIQLANLDWPEETRASLRYITNSGGAMPTSTLQQLQTKLPSTQIFLMYGLTEAFRSTYLDPAEMVRRPTSIGKAIPNAQILVLDKNGEECAIHEEGELVHRGPHVAKGYWNAPELTAQRFRSLPKKLNIGLTDEIVVWSGDRVTRDEDDFLYFIGRADDMIKSSGYRISPSELEDLLYPLVEIAEVVAIGIPHPEVGEAIVLVITPSTQAPDLNTSTILGSCQKHLPNYMQPRSIEICEALPRNANGKIDRKSLQLKYSQLFAPENPN